VAIDVRGELANVLSEYGHDVVYIRRDTRFRCTCYSERSGESSNPNCPLCFGTAFRVSLEKVKTRRKISSVPETLIGLKNTQNTGNLSPTAFVYYFQYFTLPVEGDLILEVDWNGNIPAYIREKHLVSVADPKQGTGGQIEFYQVYCRYNPKGVSDDDALTKY
jgi:hypothetical protein